MFLGPVLFFLGVTHRDALVEYNVFWSVVPESEKNEVYLFYGGGALSIIIAIVLYFTGSMSSKNKVISNLDALIDDEKDDNSKDESVKVKPEKVANLKIHRMGEGEAFTNINSKATMNFYEDNFSMDAKKLKGKILSYKYDDVIADLTGGDRMPNFLWFSTSDGSDYLVAFEKTVDKVFFVGKCNNLK
jgi:hypothetical protein|tara:strand:- start:24 stop:587 length:564 start_codon:yes stop_codon:yes gene_type:complete